MVAIAAVECAVILARFMDRAMRRRDFLLYDGRVIVSTAKIVASIG